MTLEKNEECPDLENARKMAESLLEIKEEIQATGGVKSVSLTSKTLEEAAELLMQVASK